MTKFRCEGCGNIIDSIKWNPRLCSVCFPVCKKNKLDPRSANAYLFREFLTGLYELFRDFDAEIEAEEDQIWLMTEDPFKQWHLNRFLDAPTILELLKQLEEEE